jgi:hypothetical protein
MAIWNILQTFGIFYDNLVYFEVISHYFGMLYQEKSGNPGAERRSYQLDGI